MARALGLLVALLCTLAAANHGEISGSKHTPSSDADGNSGLSGDVEGISDLRLRHLSSRPIPKDPPKRAPSKTPPKKRPQPRKRRPPPRRPTPKRPLLKRPPPKRSPPPPPPPPFPSPPPPPPSPSPPSPPDVCNTPGWTMLWQDEFDTLDSAKWGFQMYDGFQYGVGDWGNNEVAFYTNRTDNAYVADGNLVITARNEADPAWVWQNCWDECRDRCLSQGYQSVQPELQYCIDGCGWPRCDIVRMRAITSARMRTYQKFSVAPTDQFKTVRVEVRMNLPQGDGLWPAFWLLPEAGATENCTGCGAYGNWAGSGEIDVMEAVNNMTGVFGTVHYGSPWPSNVYYSTQAPLAQQITGSTGYNTFALEWSPTQMDWLLNGAVYSTAVSSNGGATSAPNAWFTTAPGSGPNAPFDVPFHLVVNLAVGGNLPNAFYQQSTGTTLELNAMKQALQPDGKQLKVDFVRVCGKA